MNYILLITLGLLTCGTYFASKKNILSPDVIICAVFTLSSFFLALNTVNWAYSISLTTYFYLFVAVILTLIGINVGTRVTLSKRCLICKSNSYKKINAIGINIFYMVLISVCNLLVIYLYFRRQLSVSIQLGNSTGLSGMIYTLRRNVYNEDTFQLGTALNIGISFVRASGYVSLFLFVYTFIHQKKCAWRYVIPIIVFIFYNVLSSGRSGFIGLVCAILYDFYFSIRTKGKVIKSEQMVKYVFGGLVGFIVLFWQLGKLTGKNLVLDFWDTISIYIGSSILCLDSLIINTNKFNFLGINTFRGVYNILARFGLDVITVSNHAEKIRWKNYSSNIFTAYGPYYLDYGPVFSLLVIFITGLIIGVMWRKFINEKGNLIIAILYGRIIAGATAMYSIAERLLSNTIALNFIVEIVFIIVMVRKCIKKENDCEL